MMSAFFGGVRRLALPIRLLGYLVLGLALLWGAWNVAHRMRIDYRSPYDEHTHFDYWYKLYHWKHVPAVYERIDARPLALWNCHTNDGSPPQMSCADAEKVEPQDSRFENTATPYLPTYYLATAWLSRLIHPFAGDGSDFHLAKTSNMIWGLVGLVLVAALALALGTPPLVAAAVVAVTAQTPIYIFMSNTFNPEIFVLLGILAGLIIYVRWLYNLNLRGFLLAASCMSALALSIKPTALLLVVIVGISELLRPGIAWRERVIRVLGYGLLTLLIYALLVQGINAWRGGGPSDGAMRDSLNTILGGRTFWVNMNMVFQQFTHSTASPGWRQLIDWHLPKVFMLLPNYMLALGALAVVYLVTASTRGAAITRQAAMFTGSALGFLALPLFLFVYLKLTHFPFFFQSRYFLPYLVTGTVLGTAFLAATVRQAWGAMETAWTQPKPA